MFTIIFRRGITPLAVWKPSKGVIDSTLGYRGSWCPHLPKAGRCRARIDCESRSGPPADWRNCELQVPPLRASRSGRNDGISGTDLTGYPRQKGLQWDIPRTIIVHYLKALTSPL